MAQAELLVSSLSWMALVVSMSASSTEAWAAAGPVIDGRGTRRYSEPRRGSDAASGGNCPRNGLRTEERGMSHAREGSAAPEHTGGRTGCPQAV